MGMKPDKSQSNRSRDRLDKQTYQLQEQEVGEPARQSVQAEAQVDHSEPLVEQANRSGSCTLNQLAPPFMDEIQVMDQHSFTDGGARSGETKEGKGEGKWKMGNENEESLSMVEQFKNKMRLVEREPGDSTGATGGKFRH